MIFERVVVRTKSRYPFWSPKFSGVYLQRGTYNELVLKFDAALRKTIAKVSNIFESEKSL